MSTSFIPYSCQNIDEADIDAVVRVLKSEYLTQGPAVVAFEAAMAALHQVAHAVSVSNATAGLHLACLALGVRPGSRVWTSPNSFLASANCALYCGADVDFVDIDPHTRNMSVGALKAKLAQAARDGTLPSLVIPVDFAGLPCDLREIRALADEHGFKVLQDASHATGASYLGSPVGSRYAHATVFSFHAVKIVTTAEGGMVVTQDAAVAEQLRLLRSHGMTRDPSLLEQPPEGPWVYEQQALGFNCRLTDVQAALGLSQLARLPAMHERRAALADAYDQAFEGWPVVTPARLPDRTSAWHLYAIEIDERRTAVSRAHLFGQLRAANIGVNVHYIPIHTQPHYRKLGFRVGDFPMAERYYQRALSLPLFPSMTVQQQARVIQVVKDTLAVNGSN